MPQQVRLGKVRKAIKSSIFWPPLLSMSVFQNSEKNRLIIGYPGGVRWWKNWLRGLFEHVSLGQVRKTIKSWKSEALESSIHLLTCFGQKFERTVFERATSSQTCLDSNCCHQRIQQLTPWSDLLDFHQQAVEYLWSHSNNMWHSRGQGGLAKVSPIITWGEGGW